MQIAKNEKTVICARFKTQMNDHRVFLVFRITIQNDKITIWILFRKKITLVKNQLVRLKLNSYEFADYLYNKTTRLLKWISRWTYASDLAVIFGFLVWWLKPRETAKKSRISLQVLITSDRRWYVFQQYPTVSISANYEHLPCPNKRINY